MCLQKRPDISFLKKESDSNQLTTSVFGVHSVATNKCDVVSGEATLNNKSLFTRNNQRSGNT